MGRPAAQVPIACFRVSLARKITSVAAGGDGVLIECDTRATEPTTDRQDYITIITGLK